MEVNFSRSRKKKKGKKNKLRVSNNDVENALGIHAIESKHEDQQAKYEEFLD